MSSDFLQEIESAVSGDTIETDESIKSDLTNKQDASVNNLDEKSKTVNDALAHLEEDYSGHIPGTEPKEKEKEEVTDEKVDEKKKEEEKETVDENKDHNKNKKDEDNQQNSQRPYLDIYLQVDKDQNLVNNKGEIIAHAGASRNHFEKMKKEGRDIRDEKEKLEIDLQNLSSATKEVIKKYEALKTQENSNNYLEQVGMDQNQFDQALGIMKAYQTNPIQGIKMLLTSAKLNGIDLSELGGQIVIDPATVASVMQKTTEKEPSKQEENSSQENITADQAKEIVTEFLDNFPDAKPHLKEIALATQKFPDKSLPEIWQAYRNYLRKNSEQEQIAAFKSDLKNSKEEKPTNKKEEKNKKPATTNSSDYGTMSFDEIKNSIFKDYEL